MLVKNLTPFFHAAKVCSRRPPQPEMTLVVRGTFRLVQGGVVEVVEDLEQGFMSGETFADDDAECEGACQYPGDFADFKLKAEVMLQGSCYPPGGRPATEVPVRFSVGAFRKELIVFGDRRWERTITGDRISEPAAFQRMPLDYAHALGGPGFPRNPVGKGLRGDELPNVEPTSQRITARGQERSPGTFAPVSSNWAERANKRGTSYGARYLAERAPYYAEDFDWTFFHAAPADQQIEGYLRGDEEVRLHNLHPQQAVFSTRLPGLRLRAFVHDDRGAFREVRMVLDTLFVEPDDGTLKLTWRGLTPVREDDLADVRTVLVASEALDEKPLGEGHYRGLLEEFEKDPTGVLAELPAELLELWERREKERRGEPVEEPPVDPALDPVSAELSRSLGPLLSPEKLGKVSAAMSMLDAAPDGQKPDLASAVAAARAARKDEAPPMETLKPGTLPDPRLRPRMRALMAQVAKLREQEKQSGQATFGLSKLEAVPHDPRWKELDPTYEPPGPLSTDLPGPGADLRERDLRDQDLRGVDLRGANLERADLSRASLHGVDLRGAKLARAVLYKTDVSEADLREADLTLVNGACLRAAGADLRGATLEEAFLERADLSGAKLDDARASYAILEEADLRKARAVGACFDHADLSNARLGGACLRRISAVLALFAEVSAEGVDLEDAELEQASFEGADLRSARLVGARAKKGFFLSTRLDGADLGHADLRDAHLTEATAIAARFFGANLRDARLYRCNLERAVLARANLMGADLRKANLEGASLARANLYEAALLDIRGSGFDLSEAKIEHAIRRPS